MKKLANFLVDRRYIFLALTLVLTVVCGALAMTVTVNRDRTKYLPDDSNMKQGMSLMESAFRGEEEKASIRVMFDDLSAAQIAEVKARLEAIPNVSSVVYDKDSAEYNRDNHTLFVVNSRYDYRTLEELAIEAAIEEGFSEYSMVYRNNDLPSSDLPLELIAFALVIALIILTVMSHSWIEPLLLFISVCIAVVINFGTNAVLPYIDEMTATVGPVLQMVLSMDYSIILTNRYRREKPLHSNKIDAMKAALTSSISSIASSSFTTAVGLLALVFLSFKLGPELGIVLAKGVFVSMLSAFFFLPSVILAMDKYLVKTKKKAPHVPMGGLSRLSYKTRYAMPAVFALLLVGSFILQSFTAIVFTENVEDPLADVFPKDNNVVIVYNSEDEERISGVVSELEKDGRISSVLGYANTLGKEMYAGEMGGAIARLSEESVMDKDIISMIYFTAADAPLPKLTASEFMNFLSDSVIPNSNFGKFIGGEIREKAEYFEKLSDKDKLTTAMTAEETAEFFGIDKENVEQLYLFYTVKNGVEDSGKMTLPVFVDFVLNTVAQDEIYSAMFEPGTLGTLERLGDYTDREFFDKPLSSWELANELGVNESMVRTAFVLRSAGDVSGKAMSLQEFTSYLCNSLMNNAMFSGYFDEATRSRVQTVDSLIQIAVSGQAMSAGQMAQTLGLPQDSVSRLYYLYFSADPTFTQETAAMTMTLSDFLTLLKANASGDQAGRLAQVEQIISLTLSGQQLDAATMAATLGQNEKEVSLVYMLNSAETMNLQQFIAAARKLVPGNTQLVQLEQISQLASSGASLDAGQLASVFGISTEDVQSIFGLVLAPQKAITLPSFTGFLVNSVLGGAYAGSFTADQAAQIQQINSIVQLAAGGSVLGADSMAQTFGMDAGLISTVFRLYYGADVSGVTMSVRAFAEYILSDSFMSGAAGQNAVAQLRVMQSIIYASLNGTEFSSKELSAFLGIGLEQAEPLYILRMAENGEGASWKISPEAFVSFVVAEVLGSEAFSEQLDEGSVDDLELANKLIEAVVSEKAYSSAEMSELIMSLTDGVSKNDIEILYLYYGGLNGAGKEIKMTIPVLFDFLCDEMLNDERFNDYFDAETRADILDGRAAMNDAIEQLRGDGYSRLVLTSDYPDESPETLAHVKNVRQICEDNLGEFYLVGNSVMVDEMSDSFGREYIMITLITALAIFLVVLIAFRNPTMPLILTLVVQCGVFITVTVIGAYAHSIFYLALLIVQSILMGATIDYGIVFCNSYRENRKSMNAPETMEVAYVSSIHTIMTSGSILVIALAILGIFVSSAMISEVCITLSIGVLVAILLILFVLPGLVACCDRLICRKKKMQSKNKTDNGY